MASRFLLFILEQEIKFPTLSYDKYKIYPTLLSSYHIAGTPMALICRLSSLTPRVRANTNHSFPCLRDAFIHRLHLQNTADRRWVAVVVVFSTPNDKIRHLEVGGHRHYAQVVKIKTVDNIANPFHEHISSNTLVQPKSEAGQTSL
ncbi:hypothetical protein BgiBS90_012756, partial [Biomphalaria glabrata]